MWSVKRSVKLLVSRSGGQYGGQSGCKLGGDKRLAISINKSSDTVLDDTNS